MLSRREIYRTLHISKRLNEIFKFCYAIRYQDDPSKVEEITPMDCLASFEGVFGDYMSLGPFKELIAEASSLVQEFEKILMGSEERMERNA
jgi:hypothetical protein